MRLQFVTRLRRLRHLADRPPDRATMTWRPPRTRL